MTRLQILTRAAIRRGAASGTLVAATKTRYGNSLEESHKKLLRMPGMESLLWVPPLTFASVADQKYYALPAPSVERINRITERTNDRRLFLRTPDWLDSVDPDPQSGTPTFYIPHGYAEVHTQPSDASAVFVDSTAAGDTGTAYVEGIRSGGYPGSASVTMTGTTAVQIGSITDFIHITKFYLSAAAVGTVTLHEDASGGTELSRIPIGKSRSRFAIVQLYPTPGAVVTYYASVTRSVPDMSNDTDEPLIPENFHDLLIDMVEFAELKKADDPNRWQMLKEAIYGDGRRNKGGIQELKDFVTNHPDWHPRMGGQVTGINNVGGWYPADVWR